MEKLISLKKAAEILDVTTQTLRNWDKTGKLKPVRTLGGHRKYKESEIMRLIDFENGEEENN